MKIIRKATTLALLTLFTSINIINVYAEESYEKISISTPLTVLESKEQEHHSGGKEQLSKVNIDTMKFINSIASDAIQSGRDYGLYPSITIAQAVLETGSGKSSLSREPYNNIFGIKGSYKGQSVEMRTGEHNKSGGKYYIHANFRKYPSFEESLRDHDRLLRFGLNGYYSCAWRENSSSSEEAAKCLQGKYATDTNYASKLINIIRTYNLSRFDGHLTPRDIKWLNSGSLDPWELPIVPEEIMSEVQTWASSPNDSIAFSRENDNQIMNESVDKFSAGKHYIEETLEIKIKVKNEDIRKEKPEVGNIAIYKSESSNGQTIENYAIVEGFRENAILISEGVMIDKKITEVSRLVPNNLLSKYEFIDIKDL